MQKLNYLKYFKKSRQTTNVTDSSFDKSLISFDGQNQIDLNKQQKDKYSYSKKEQDQGHSISPTKLLKTKTSRKSFKTLNNQIRNSGKSIQKIKINQIKLTQYQDKKYFPQIPQQSSGKVTNDLSSLKIQSPKRSKLISHSLHGQILNRENIPVRLKTLESVSFYNPTSTQQSFYAPIKPYDRNKTAPNKKFKTLKTTFGDLNSSCRNYNDIYTISLENERMGWRIVNTRSMIEQYLNSSYFTYHLYNGNLLNRDKFKSKDLKAKKKVNLKQMKNVFKVFFNENTLSNIKNQNQNQKIFEQIKPKDQMQKYILSQSQVKQKLSKCQSEEASQNNSLTFQRNKQNIERWENENSKKKIKPCFFRSTYRKKEKLQNDKLFQKKKILNKKSLYKQTNSRQKEIHEKGRKNLIMQTQPNAKTQDRDENFTQNYQFQCFGKGSTIIELKNIEIESNPQIRNHDVLMLELIDRNFNPVNKQSAICTPALTYMQLKKGVKFGINIKIGDFIPLKIWKYHGINMIELGIVDLNLIAYKNRNNYFEYQNSAINENKNEFGLHQIQLYCQQKINPFTQKKQQRQILYYHSKQKLRKNKKIQIEVSIEFSCLIYNKKFGKQRNSQIKSRYKVKNFSNNSAQNSFRQQKQEQEQD